jgi:methylmalonyl-CoA carboxyltransferase large subunit
MRGKGEPMGLFLLPLGLLAGWMAGTAMSRRMIRQEVHRLESLIGSDGAKAPPAAAPVPVPAAAPAAPPPAAPKTAEPEKVEEISPDVILVLGAAVAAFLGKRARIKSTRLVRTAPSNAWAQQGRVFVQASHNLGVMHGR